LYILDMKKTISTRVTKTDTRARAERLSELGPSLGPPSYTMRERIVRPRYSYKLR